MERAIFYFGHICIHLLYYFYPPHCTTQIYICSVCICNKKARLHCFREAMNTILPVSVQRHWQRCTRRLLQGLAAWTKIHCSLKEMFSFIHWKPFSTIQTMWNARTSIKWSTGQTLEQVSFCLNLFSVTYNDLLKYEFAISSVFFSNITGIEGIAG